MSITSSIDRIIEGYDEELVQAYEAALFIIEGDDTSIIRVVANEPLSEAEEQQWVVRARWRLKFSQGKLLVAGGFDPNCFQAWRDQTDQEEDDQEDNYGYVKDVDVSPGDYQVTLYSYLHSMNGAMWSSDFYESIGKGCLLPKLAPWFRNDHPGRALPSWLAAELADDSFDNDDEWAPSLAAAFRTGRLQIEKEPHNWVGYLVHLTPFVEGMELDRPASGWFEAKTGLRVPARFPLGIPSILDKPDEVKSRLDRFFENIEKIKPEGEQKKEKITAPACKRSRRQGRQRRKIVITILRLWRLILLIF